MGRWGIGIEGGYALWAHVRGRFAPAVPCLDAGSARRTGSFLLLRQKKRTKEKATPHPRPFGVPSLRTIEAAPAGLGLRPQTSSAKPRPACSSLGAPEGNSGGMPRSLGASPTFCVPRFLLGARGIKADFAGTQLAMNVPAHIGAWFSSPWPAPKEWSETLGSRPTEGSPEGRKAGSPFLWFVSFGEAKEMNPYAGRNRHLRR